MRPHMIGQNKQERLKSWLGHPAVTFAYPNLSRFHRLFSFELRRHFVVLQFCIRAFFYFCGHSRPSRSALNWVSLWRGSIQPCCWCVWQTDAVVRPAVVTLSAKGKTCASLFFDG